MTLDETVRRIGQVLADKAAHEYTGRVFVELTFNCGGVRTTKVSEEYLLESYQPAAGAQHLKTG